MPTASPTADRSLFTGVLVERRDDLVVIAAPGTDYRLHLVPTRQIVEQPGKRISGTIHAQATRIDVIPGGGIYVEPVIGRPRRVQGRIIAVDATGGTVTVLAVAPMVCRTDGRQKASQFEVSQLVSFDVEPGATFTPAF